MTQIKEWLTCRWLRRQKESQLKLGDKVEAQKMIASEPLRGYLISLIGELVREGIYLSSAKQEGVKYTVELLSEQIKKGEALFKK